jgi:uncharacterized cupin superfamily protein
VITHWDEVDEVRRERGHIAATWQSLTGEHSVAAGVQRIRIDPGAWATPLHLEGSEEEIFFVLAGTGVSLQWADSDEAFAVGPGDCLVHLALEHAHTLRAGPDGLDVLAFGQRHYAANTLLPRADVSWLGPTWVRRGAPDDHPWKREAEAGAPEIGELLDRPGRIVNVGDVEPDRWDRRGDVRVDRRDLGRTAGSLRTGILHARVDPGALMAPPHSHSAEEEIFVVLDGSGTFELWPSPRYGGELERHPIRAGTTIARPAGSTRPHALRAGAEGMTVLAYGTREANDICFYPRSGKISLRGVGVIGRLEQLDYWDGEE